VSKEIVIFNRIGKVVGRSSFFVTNRVEVRYRVRKKVDNVCVVVC